MIDPFLFFKGFAMGFILAVVTPPATIWMVQLGFKRNWAYANMAGAGLAVGQAFLAMLVGYCFFLIIPFWEIIGMGLRVIAIIILTYMGWRSFWVDGATSVHLPPGTRIPKGGGQVFQQSFYILVTMPMRVPTVLAYMIATAMLYQMGGMSGLIDMGIGTFCGAVSWNIWICLLGWVSKGRIDEPIILKSLNKQNRFAAFVFGALLLITIGPVLEQI